jgi:hypothetical protein
MLRFITNLASVVLAGFIQSTPWFAIAGVKPNLVLVLTLIFFIVFEYDWLERVALALTAELSLQFAPTPDTYGFVFLGVVIVCGLAIDYLHLQPRLTLAVTTVFATVILNIVGALQWVVMTEETIYNLVLAAVIYALIEFIYGKKLFTR